MAPCNDDCSLELEHASRRERRTLVIVLLIRFRGRISICGRPGSAHTTHDGNLGVLLAAAAVFWSGSPLPDILIGLAIATVVIRSAWRVMSEVRQQLARV